MDRIHHKIDQNTPEWHALRDRLITSSTFSDLFMAPSTAGYQKAISKVAFGRLGVKVSNFKGSKYTDEGHIIEPIGAELFELETLNELQDGGFWTYGDWLGSSPDRLVNDDAIWEHKGKVTENTILEAYTKWDKGIRLTEKSNKKAWFQVMHQLYVTGRDLCHFQITAMNMKPLIEEIRLETSTKLRIEQKVEEVIPIIKNEMEVIKKYIDIHV